MAGETHLWIDGDWEAGERLVPLKNPYSQDVIAQIGYASPAQAERAIAVAARAARSFRQVPAWQRAAILRKVADLISDRKDELVDTIAREAAKPVKAARQEIDRTVETYRFAAEAARTIHGETVPMDAAPRGEHHVGFTMWQPLGVVAAITPFNFPMNLVAHKVGPAIAAGNAIVLKPAEQTPLSALVLGHIFADAGLPKGVLNIIPGDGKELSEVLTTHPDVAYVTFTGSPSVGRQIRAQAGLRRVTLELGSNSPLIVDEGFSEQELGKIASEIVSGAFAYSGQVCISIQRVYIHDAVFDDFVERIVAGAKALRFGDPIDEATDVSALINEQAGKRLAGWLDEAKAAGAKILCGGDIDGNRMQPTVVTGVPADAKLVTEEAFGPVVVVERISSWEVGVELANRSKFGLNAGVFTKRIDRALAAVETLQAGAVLVNQVPTYRLDHMPYGGVKESGVGREGVVYAMYDMMERKLAAFRTKSL
ncbi:aldehyde dehydrogenase [Alicyclobacillus hesperidum]|uniref:Aldehyde dehydrogenase n=1 Tax=Alicyclobacillus hesperidum TaxID=89784 RepID=A0AA37X417_9BACL|nr:aldehyde dehydrogenase family protein [Alicyclobacillus hesperidum]GLV13402.1 aldehyde dehydrogenase [Alicyclobacillus hesperidum]